MVLINNGVSNQSVWTNIGQNLDMDKDWTKLTQNIFNFLIIDILDKYWTIFRHGQYLDKNWTN